MYEINWWWDSMLNNVLYDTPITLDPTTFAELPWLASSWETEPWTAPNGISGTKITFHLNSGVKWHDGRPLTAEDVVFTWDYAQQQQNPVYISYLTSYVNGEAPNAATAVAYMNTTSYWALHWVGTNIPIIPKHIWQNIEDSVTYQPISEGNLIGSGPYIFKEYKPGEYVIVTANPNYFLKPSDSTLSFTQVSMTQGENKVYTSNPAIYDGTPVINGTYTITVASAGTTVKTFTGTAKPDGTYTATLDTKDLAPGTYDMFVELAVKVGVVGIGSFDEYRLTVAEKPVDYVLYGGILAAIVVVVAAGYMVIRRRKPQP
jgi:ABC-type transport system substrate-binding protein